MSIEHQEGYQDGARRTKRLSNAETDIDYLEQQPPEQQQETDEGRFRLNVDRQTKSSYETAEAAGRRSRKGTQSCTSRCMTPFRTSTSSLSYQNEP
jgi:hypothetical protein